MTLTNDEVRILSEVLDDCNVIGCTLMYGHEGKHNFPGSEVDVNDRPIRPYPDLADAMDRRAEQGVFGRRP